MDEHSAVSTTAAASFDAPFPAPQPKDDGATARVRLQRKFGNKLPPELFDEFVRLYRIRKRHRDYPGLLICPLSGCDVPSRTVVCPAHCPRVKCPAREKREPLIPWLRRNMAVLRPLLPAHPPPIPMAGQVAATAAAAGGRESSQRRRLLLVTTTFQSEQQLMRLEHLALVLAAEPDVLWIVVEDASEPSSNVSALLAARAHVQHLHLAYGPTRRGGNAQRNRALQHIRAHRLAGVVYNLDDDNGYHPRLWNELRRLEPDRVGVLAVRRAVFPPPRCDGRFLPLRFGERRQIRIERPVYDNATGRFVRFDAGWCGHKSWMSRKYGARTFCVDMGGFAFDADLLRRVPSENIWEYKRHGGGESELIAKLLPGGAPEDLQPLANCGQDVLVFHNEWRLLPVAMLSPPMRCGTDGRVRAGGNRPAEARQLAS